MWALRLNKPEWIHLFVGSFASIISGFVWPVLGVFLGSIMDILLGVCATGLSGTSHAT